MSIWLLSYYEFSSLSGYFLNAPFVKYLIVAFGTQAARLNAAAELPQLVMDSRIIVIALCSNVAIILCFGTLFPPLALVGGVAVIGQLLWVQVFVIRLSQQCEKLIHSVEQASNSCDQKTDHGAAASLSLELIRDLHHKLGTECVGFPPIYMKTVKSVSIYVAIIWGIFLWDIIGDEVGFTKSSWIFVFMVVVGISIRFQRDVFDCMANCVGWKQGNHSTPEGVELPRETVIELRNTNSSMFLTDNPLHTTNPLTTA